MLDVQLLGLLVARAAACNVNPSDFNASILERADDLVELSSMHPLPIEDRLATTKVSQQANRKAWRLKNASRPCPSLESKNICSMPECSDEVCSKLAVVGLDANRQPLRKRNRPKCGAMT